MAGDDVLPRTPIPPPLFDNEDEDKRTRTPFMDDIHCRDQSNHPRSTLKHRQEQRALTLQEQN